MSNKLSYILIFILCQSLTSLAADRLSADNSENLLRLRTNLPADALTVANIGTEHSIDSNWTAGLDVTFSPWDITSTRKLRTLLLLPEARYYFKSGWQGFYVGAHAHCGLYNVAWDGTTRYQDKDGRTPLWGAGISAGAVLPFGSHWGADINLGMGYARLEYDEFYNLEKGAKYTVSTKDWWGPTRAGISIYYRF